ncbi:MAG TPA: MerR family transcriptional regulator [Clostridiales bacterium]|nr:MerR family transcriptional regulator [Clostridiales bacterium]
MDKNKKYSISEVSEITGYDKHVLRYYEEDFNLKIPRTESNRRYYTYKEIETFLYIKRLQEKGLTNKQIKLVLECPEILIQETQNELAISSMEVDKPFPQRAVTNSELREMCNQMVSSIAQNVKNEIEETKKEIIDYLEQGIRIREPLGGIEKPDLENKEKDILLCENARLKMKIKEKSYEIVQLKEKINQLTQKKVPFWKRIFSSS